MLVWLKRLLRFFRSLSTAVVFAAFLMLVSAWALFRALQSKEGASLIEAQLLGDALVSRPHCSIFRRNV